MSSRPSPRKLPLSPADLRGAVRLATEATLGLTSLVEAMHARIAPTTPAAGRAAGRTAGLTGFVYGSVRGITRLAGGGADRALALAGPLLQRWMLPGPAEVFEGGVATAAEAPAPHLQREAVLAALNGVLGDHLAASGNPLAIPMTFRHRGRPLRLQRQALAAALPAAGPRVLVLLHGLCMNDLQWQHEGHDHGAMLARDAGWTPLHLHYNSGLPIATNGRQLADLLERLLQVWPQPVQRVALLGHSMGGLLARSALHQGLQAGHAWPAQVHDLVMLASPHHGAPLERAGHGVDRLLADLPYTSRYTAPLARLGQIRSAGITDLRHGRVTAADDIEHAPLPRHVRAHVVAAQLGAAQGLRGRVTNGLLGDGLVPLDSALGRHDDPARHLPIAADRQTVVHGVGHLALLGDPVVAARLRQWLK